MTAVAMIIGMLPMAIGIGEGAEQNAPLGRAVIGGLIFATAATLFLVPALFSIAHRSEEHTSELQSLMRISYAVFCLKKKNKITQLKSQQPQEKTHTYKHQI